MRTLLALTAFLIAWSAVGQPSALTFVFKPSQSMDTLFVTLQAPREYDLKYKKVKIDIMENNSDKFSRIVTIPAFTGGPRQVGDSVHTYTFLLKYPLHENADYVFSFYEPQLLPIKPWEMTGRIEKGKEIRFEYVVTQEEAFRAQASHK
jgi:multidrug efflux pump subunit AcrB